MNVSPIKEVPWLFLTKHYSFHYKKINFKEAITAMYVQISGEWAMDPEGSTEQALKTNALVYPVMQRRKQNLKFASPWIIIQFK
jgi:hypothetical protein